MTESNDNSQQASQEKSTSQDTSQNRQSSASSQRSDNSGDSQQHMIPKSRMDEVNKKNKELAERLVNLESERDQQEEEKAKAEGNKDELLDKRTKKLQKVEEELKQERADRQREKQLNTFYSAASGVIKPNAMRTAFMLLSEDELSGVDDTEGMQKLAAGLVELHDYLGVEQGPHGAGSGGSRSPVLTAGQSSGQRQGSSSGAGGIQPILKRRKRPSWK